MSLTCLNHIALNLYRTLVVVGDTSSVACFQLFQVREFTALGVEAIRPSAKAFSKPWQTQRVPGPTFGFVTSPWFVQKGVIMGVSENSVPRKTQWFCWSLSRFEKWLFHWEYIPNMFRQTHISQLAILMRKNGVLNFWTMPFWGLPHLIHLHKGAIFSTFKAPHPGSSQQTTPASWAMIILQENSRGNSETIRRRSGNPRGLVAKMAKSVAFVKFSTCKGMFIPLIVKKMVAIYPPIHGTKAKLWRLSYKTKFCLEKFTPWPHFFLQCCLCSSAAPNDPGVSWRAKSFQSLGVVLMISLKFMKCFLGWSFQWSWGDVLWFVDVWWIWLIVAGVLHVGFAEGCEM